MVELAFFDIEEAQGVGGLFPERAFAESTVDFDPGLSQWNVSYG